MLNKMPVDVLKLYAYSKKKIIHMIEISVNYQYILGALRK